MARAVTMTGREESEIAMRETTDSPGGPGTGETVPTLGDPTALPGLETAAQGLFNYCPSTLLGAKAIQAVRGDGAPRLHEGGDREQQLRAITKLGYGIALVGLFCPIFRGSSFAGLTGEELKWSAIHSGLVALSGLLLAGWYRVRLGRLGRDVS